MTKQHARYLLYQHAHRQWNRGDSHDDFLEGFEMCYGGLSTEVEEAYSLVPEVLEHIAHVVWFPY